MSDETKGIYRKYEVTRLNDPVGKHKNCNYFVLDLIHDEFALPALKAYAKACKKKYPQLAKDLQWAIGLASGPEGSFFSSASLSTVLGIKMERNS